MTMENVVPMRRVDRGALRAAPRLRALGPPCQPSGDPHLFGRPPPPLPQLRSSVGVPKQWVCLKGRARPKRTLVSYGLWASRPNPFKKFLNVRTS
jgi:hypothetical protein